MCVKARVSLGSLSAASFVIFILHGEQWPVAPPPPPPQEENDAANGGPMPPREPPPWMKQRLAELDEEEATKDLAPNIKDLLKKVNVPTVLENRLGLM